VSVHHIDVDPVGTGFVDGPDFLPEAGEIGRKYRRSDADRLLHGGTLPSARLARQGSGALIPG
jgi:hypothetical protein